MTARPPHTTAKALLGVMTANTIGVCMSDSDFARIEAALERVATLATRLGPGESETNVRQSAELGVAVRTGNDPSPALDRLIRSLEQLQSARHDGRRRDEQHGAPDVSRILEAIQEELVPALRQSR